MMVNAITILRKRLDSINTHIEVLRRIENITRQQIDNEDINYIQSKQTDEIEPAWGGTSGKILLEKITLELRPEDKKSREGKGPACSRNKEKADFLHNNHG